MPAPTRKDLIDRVDDHDVIVGTVPRGKALERHAGFRVVHVIALDSADRILLQRVGSVGTRSPGRWGSSVAGYLHAGEDPLSGATRRAREEIGLSTPISFCGRTRMNDEGSSKFIYVYLASVVALPRIKATGHISSLEFRDWSVVERQLQMDPHAFTETFPYVFDVVRAAIEGRGSKPR